MTLLQVIGDLLTPAVGVALSPVPIIAVILILSTSRARTKGAAFALGWVAGLTLVSTVVLLLLGDSSAGDPSPFVGWIKLGFGLLFLVIAAKQWRQRPRPGNDPEPPSWMRAIDGFTPGKSLAVGGLLAGVNPKNLAMTLSAATAIAHAGLTGVETAVATAIFVALGSLTVAGSVLFYFITPDSAEPRLASLQTFMSDNNAVIMTVLMLVLGTKLVGDALTALI